MLIIPHRSKTVHGAAYASIGAGSEDKEPLLLVHGVGLRMEAWSPQVEEFSSTHRVIAVDMPGHGESKPLPRGAQIEQFVDWLKEFIDDIGCGPVNLCGHSMGALIAKGFSLTYPDTVARLALVCGVHRRQLAAREAVIARANEITNGCLDVEGPLARWYNLKEGSPELDVARQTRQWLEAVSPEGYAAAYRAFATSDTVYADRLNEISCPALFLTGEFDPNSTPEMVEEMASLTPDSKAVVVPNEKHMVNLINPKAVNDAIRDWLAKPVNKNN